MVAIYDLTAQQLTNAQAIYDAAKPYGRDAVMGALMAAGAESSWLRYANNGKSTRTDVSAAAKKVAAVSMTFDHDAVAGEAWTTADSVGLFQQRPMFGYGTVAELMDPARSTTIFLTGNAAHTTRAFMDAPTGLTLAQRVQWAQGSEFPTGDNYAPFEGVAAQLIERFDAVDIPTSPTPATPSTGLGATALEALMAFTADQQQQLDKYKGDIADWLIWHVLINGAPVADFLQNPRAPKELVDKVDALAGQVNFLYQNELFKDDAGNVTLPYSRTAANFNDVRAGFADLVAKVDALTVKVDALGAALDAK